MSWKKLLESVSESLNDHVRLRNEYLKHLGYTISDQTVGNILKRHGIPPAPERKKTVIWGEFVRSHWDVLVATGFFQSEVWSRFGLAMSCLLSLIHFSRYQVQAPRLIIDKSSASR